MNPAVPWAAVDALHARYRKERHPGDFTVAEYLERYPALLARDAMRILEHMVRDGELVKSTAVIAGRITNVYRIPEVPCPTEKRSTSGRTSSRATGGGSRSRG